MFQSIVHQIRTVFEAGKKIRSILLAVQVCTRELERIFELPKISPIACAPSTLTTATSVLLVQSGGTIEVALRQISSRKTSSSMGSVTCVCVNCIFFKLNLGLDGIAHSPPMLLDSFSVKLDRLSSVGFLSRLFCIWLGQLVRGGFRRPIVHKVQHIKRRRFPANRCVANWARRGPKWARRSVKRWSVIRADRTPNWARWKECKLG